MTQIKELYKQNEEVKRCDTFTFETQTNSAHKSKRYWKIKVDLDKDEDYSTAFEKAKKIILLYYPLTNIKDIKFISSE